MKTIILAELTLDHHRCPSLSNDNHTWEERRGEEKRKEKREKGEREGEERERERERESKQREVRVKMQIHPLCNTDAVQCFKTCTKCCVYKIEMLFFQYLSYLKNFTPRQLFPDILLNNHTSEVQMFRNGPTTLN